MNRWIGSWALLLSSSASSSALRKTSPHTVSLYHGCSEKSNSFHISAVLPGQVRGFPAGKCCIFPERMVELWQRRRRYVTRLGTQCIPARRHGADPAVAAAKGRYVRLPAGAGDGTAQRRTAENPGGFPVPGAVPAAGAGTDLRPPGAGGQADDPRILPPGACRRSPAGGNDPGI